MLKEIISAWKAKDMLVEVFDTFHKMLEETEEMFKNIFKVMYEEGPGDELEKQVYKTDIVVNKAERKVRKQIVEHLVLRPDVDMPACLILMSVVKDAERIGDYCKNLTEAFHLLNGLKPDVQYSDEFKKMHLDIVELFANTRQAISEHSEEIGKEVIMNQVTLSKQCDNLLTALAAKEIETRRAVVYTLMLRHYKRIVSHLSNVATSVVVPVHKIDYYYEKDEEEKKHYLK